MKNEIRVSDHLDGKHGVFFMLGIILAIGSVLLAFEWNPASGPVKDIEAPDELVEWIEVIPRTNQEKPPVSLPKNEIKKEKIKAKIDLIDLRNPIIETKREVKTQIKATPTVPYVEPPVDAFNEPDPDKVYEFVEFPPEFPGGIEAFYSFLYKNIRYPSFDLDMGNEGKVFVQFIVNRNGDISDISILRGISKSIDREVIRVLNLSPDWRPGIQNDDRVRVRYTLPIVFELKGR